jgi:hypothetical protein
MAASRPAWEGRRLSTAGGGALGGGVASPLAVAASVVFVAAVVADQTGGGSGLLGAVVGPGAGAGVGPVVASGWLVWSVTIDSFVGGIEVVPASLEGCAHTGDRTKGRFGP